MTVRIQNIVQVTLEHEFEFADDRAPKLQFIIDDLKELFQKLKELKSSGHKMESMEHLQNCFIYRLKK